jgi:N6-L-threonylcarbamoyladenine synthase
MLMVLILAIESSCDDTCVALVSSEREIISNLVMSQNEAHSVHNGVVPEIASRLHVKNVRNLAERVLKNQDIFSLSAVAATGGPGLIGGLITGVTFAKAMAISLGKPFIAINHLEGHALTVRLTNDTQYPYLLLLMSGGHCQFVAVLQLGKYEVLGSTLDDALGEVFDKLARMLGLPYPGGPVVEAYAKKGNPHAFILPQPLINEEGSNLSFSGLKTFLRNLILDLGILNQAKISDICASFQYTVGKVLVKKCKNAMSQFERLIQDQNQNTKTLVLSGGVAANLYLRQTISDFSVQFGFTCIAPPLHLCTDNAAMIAWAAQERFVFGQSDSMDFRPRSRWPMDSLS